MPMMTVGEAVLKSARWLADRGIDSPRLDAELLLAKILNGDRLRLYMDWQKPLTDLEISGYREFIVRRGTGREPVARITGTRQFLGREFEVSKETFVPRPETEGVVERALMLLEKEPALANRRQVVFEIGTGTGIIIVSIAAQSDAHDFIATDVSAGALATARRNAKRHGVEGRIDFRNAANFDDFHGTIGLIVSNPPYIASAEIPTLAPEVKTHDPMLALDGGADGLDVVRIIAREGAKLLLHGGWTVLEIGEEQGPATLALFTPEAGYAEARIEKDLAGLDRYLLARRG